MAYTPPEGDNVTLNFSGAYAPPAGDGVTLNFTEEVTTKTSVIIVICSTA